MWSPGKARLDAQVRITHLHRLESALTDQRRTLGRRPSTTVTAVTKRGATLLRRHPARSFLEVQVSGGEGDPDQLLTLSWTVDPAALAAAATVDGRYVLGTNDPTRAATQMLTLATRRDVPEKRFALVKGPLAVRPLYLQKQGRILGLVFCTMVALLVFALLELLAHRATVPLSGTVLLEQCASLAVLVVVCTDGSTLRLLTGLTPSVAAVLRAFGGPSRTITSQSPADHHAKDRLSAATGHVRAALALQTEMGAALEAARTRVVLAVALAAEVAGTGISEEACRLLTEALAQFTASGATLDLAEAEQLAAGWGEHQDRSAAGADCETGMSAL